MSRRLTESGSEHAGQNRLGPDPMNGNGRSTRIKRHRIATRIVAGGRQALRIAENVPGESSFRVVFSGRASCNLSSCVVAEGVSSRRQPTMVRAKGSSKRSSRHERSSYAPSSHGSSKMSTRPSSPRGRRSDSIDSLYSRDSSYDSLRHPPKYSDMSRHRPRHYGRMVCDAVARLKSRKGSSIKDIAKTLERKYPESLKAGSNTTEKVIATAKKLVRAGKLKKDGSNYFLIKTKSRGSDDVGSVRSHHMHGQEKRHSGDRHSHSSHRGRSDSRGRPRNSSRSRSSGQRTRSYSRSRSRSRKAVTKRTGSRKQKRGRPRNASGRKSLKRARGSKRKKKGARKGHTRLATGRRGPHQKKLSRARRRVKHTYTRRPKSDKLPEGDSSQNKGWFGGWFGGRGGGDAKQPGNDKGTGKKPEKRSKSTHERPIAGGQEPGAV